MQERQSNEDTLQVLNTVYAEAETKQETELRRLSIKRHAELLKVDRLHLVQVGKIISSAKILAKRYRKLTGRPLGITGEVAEYEAVRLLDLELADVRQPGYDATRRKGPKIERLQIKGRCILSPNPGQRLSKIDLKKEWDGILLVMLDANFEPTEIYQAQRLKVTEALTKPGSKARNERGALSVSKFKSIGVLVWSRDS